MLNSAVQGLLCAIEERMSEPSARGLANAVGQAVGDGALGEGDRLPPIRTVAVQLGLSPTTVSAAWALLARAGTIHTDGRRGTVVTDRHAGPTRYRRALRLDAPFSLDLSTGTPDHTLLPDLQPALRRIAAAAPLTYLDDPVLPALAEVLAADWPFPAERIAVVDGAMDALQLLADAHLRFGDRVAVEEPSFPPLLDLLDSLGVVSVPVALDDDGPVPDGVRAAVAGGARALIVQPRAQNPTGASLTPERVAALADALGDGGVLVIEDDSSGAVASTPALSLGVLRPESTVHIRSYSKSHGPDLRLAAIGGAAALVEPIVERRFLGQGWTSRLLQALLLDLLTRPASRRAVERARSVYATRRSALVTALAGEGVPVGGKDGLNLWLPVADESAALLRLATQGIGAAPGGPFFIDGRRGGHLRVTAGLVRSGHRGLAADLAAAARAGGRPRLS